MFPLRILLMLCLLSGAAEASQLKSSWYSEASLVKEGTRKPGELQLQANGKVFNENALTCACRLYKLGEKLKITNLNNGKSVIVVVTDRIGKRFANLRIDLSKRAFQSIANLDTGIIPISVSVVK
jgi:rare lipoprotein A